MLPLSRTANPTIKPRIANQQHQDKAPAIDEMLRFAATSYALMVVPLVPAWLVYQMPNLGELLFFNTVCISIALLGIYAIEKYSGNI